MVHRLFSALQILKARGERRLLLLIRQLVYRMVRVVDVGAFGRLNKALTKWLCAWKQVACFHTKIPKTSTIYHVRKLTGGQL